MVECDPRLMPLDVLRAWPAAWPLAATWSASEPSPPTPPNQPRWTCLALAGETLFPDSLEAIDTAIRSRAFTRAANDHDPCTGWIGWLGYDLGRTIEPACISPRVAGGESWRDDRHCPPACLRRCDSLLAFEHASRCWWLIGEPASPHARQLADFFRSVPARPDAPSGLRHEATAFSLGTVSRTTPREAFEASIARVIEHLRAGDAYQVNLAHRLSCDFSGSARALFARLTHTADPWHGAYIEADAPARATHDIPTRLALASASPELFLRFDPRSGRLETRPMKGTRPLEAHPSELLESDKEKAELTMIVDLMRNDLGRIAHTGSVRVDVPRALERHGGCASGGVLQATASISATLRERTSLTDILRATFPPGSVTGAPKVSAMRIIESLEPVRRGPYCGAIGFFGDDGGLNLSVAIRTACIRGHAPAASAPGAVPLDAFTHGTLDYAVGAGIVADSIAAHEWQETLTKARVLDALLQAGQPRTATPASAR